jgi:hypothetical protein
MSRSPIAHASRAAAVLAAVLLIVGVVQARPPAEPLAAPAVREAGPAPGWPLTDAIVVYSENFDDGLPHGWQAVDLTYQPGVWHQTTWDNGEGPRGVMWCGTTFDGPSGDGYGNLWDQELFRDVTLPAGSVSLDYVVQYDMEIDFDFLSVQLSPDAGATWSDLATYTGSTDLAYATHSHDLSAWAGQDVRIRFHFTSDSGWSDEDGMIDTEGAAHLDEVSITGLGTDDFESGPGEWIAPGSSVGGGPDHPDLQYRLVEVPFCTPDEECPDQRWTWVGYTEEPPHEFPVSPDGTIEMGIESPVLEIPTGEGAAYTLQFLVHADMPAQDNLFFCFDVASPPVDEGGEWLNDNFLHYAVSSEFIVFSRDITTLIDPGAERLQLRIYAREVVSGFPQPPQRSPSPMFDEIAVLADNVVPTFLQTVDAVCEDGVAVLRWTSFAGANCAGFHVDRLAGESGSPIRLTTTPVTARDDGGQPGGYVFRDDTVQPGAEYRYELVAMTASGEARFGPYRVTVPPASGLDPNAPNPFNPSTSIGFSLPRESPVRLTIHDLQGQLVRCLVDATLSAGTHTATWDGCDEAGRALGSGVYLYRLQTEESHQVRKMVLVR